ncbi:MAG: NAD(P)-dependent oxidoreductase [Candidatus Latescibacterota bacterium]|jgi:D-3-phosphoglycerate dehydrogenase
MRQLNVLFLPHPNTALATPWGADIIAILSARHQLRVFDREKNAAAQFEGIKVIVDLGGNISPELLHLAAAAGVQFLQVQTTGLDHVDVDSILGAGLLLAHCPGQLSSVALAQSAMMFILMHAHCYKQAEQNFSRGTLYFPTGTELVGRTLALIGFGSSAQDLARRAKAFGLKVAAIDIRPIEEEILAEIEPDFIGGPDDIDRVLSESDYVSLHLHLTPQTRHTIDARRIGLMKDTACLINVARGGLVDEDALYRALVDKRLGGAGLDVFAQEPPDPNLAVYQLPNVFTTPHTAGSTDGTSRKRAQFAADNLDRYARGEKLSGQVIAAAAGSTDALTGTPKTARQTTQT